MKAGIGSSSSCNPRAGGLRDCRAPAASCVPVIELTNLSVVREQTILRDINWRVLPGERWVILGANGSGKTSLISALAGHLAPTKGEVRLLGETYGRSDWRNLRTKIGMVSPFVTDRIDPASTGLEIVITGRAGTIGLYHSPGSTEMKEAHALLRVLGCTRLAARTWSTLSQGEQKRVLIARALMARYDVLFLDEPCASLDPVAREEFLRTVRRIIGRRNGPAVVLVTHHIEEIMPEFTHVLMLKKGVVLAGGRIEDMMSPKLLSSVYGSRVRLGKEASGRYRLAMEG